MFANNDLSARIWPEHRQAFDFALGTVAGRNHLILMGPEGVEKTTLIRQVAAQLNRPCIYVNLRQTPSRDAFLSRLLQEMMRLWPTERVNQFVEAFGVSRRTRLNIETGAFEWIDEQTDETLTLLERIFGMIESLSEETRCLVIFDEFQKIVSLEDKIEAKMRAIIQLQKKINYVFIGSDEKQMIDIFLNVRNPFYRIGAFLYLQPVESSR